MTSLLSATAAVLTDALRPHNAPQIYAGLDRTSLGLLEKVWVGWYETFGNPVLATAVAAFLLHEVSRSLPQDLLPAS